MAKDDKVRVNVTVSSDVKQWLEEESERTAIPQSTLILIALKTYIDQQKMLTMASQMDYIEKLVGNNTFNLDKKKAEL